jgi:ribosomal protein S18 acetylase RimI-like enzyme
MARITRAETPDDITATRILFEEYAASLVFGLDFQDFEHELESFPGEYAAPTGCLLLARERGRAAGCVALRNMGEGTCEMKRMYVVPRYRGRGIGRELAVAVIDEARRLGYARMRLDTVAAMEEANALYRSLGFRLIKPYRYNPLPDALFMELDLEGGD